MQLIASLIEAESGTAGVAGVETQTTPASRFRWPAVAADPIQRPCARAVSIAHTEIPSEIVETKPVKWGPPEGRQRRTPCRPRQLGEQSDRRGSTSRCPRGF